MYNITPGFGDFVNLNVPVVTKQIFPLRGFLSVSVNFLCSAGGARSSAFHVGAAEFLLIDDLGRIISKRRFLKFGSDFNEITPLHVLVKNSSINAMTSSLMNIFTQN